VHQDQHEDDQHDTPRLRDDTQLQTTWNTVADLLIGATGYE